MTLFDTVFAAVGLVGLGWILWLTLIDARRRRLPVAVLLAAGMDAACGLASFLLGGAHLLSVVGRALRGTMLEGTGDFTYDFRFYSLVMLGLLLVVPGILCLWSASRLAKAQPVARKIGFWASLVLVVVNGPLIPIQKFAILLGGLALLNLVVLAGSHQRVLGKG
jgi:hypothetical protein